MQNKSFILSKSGKTFCNLRSIFVNDSIWGEEIGLGLSTPSILPPGLKSHDIVTKTPRMRISLLGPAFLADSLSPAQGAAPLLDARPLVVRLTGFVVGRMPLPHPLLLFRGNCHDKSWQLARYIVTIGSINRNSCHESWITLA